ncbi:hypothetical protein [Paenibacillus sp. LjRoot56]|uniref:hypothetical protein n=1 Tax=Paenibacillus sp. LjRoot56 TaxID=3342333 RepID=UPI003ED03A82
MIEVKSFTDRKGNKVRIGDYVGYVHQGKIICENKVVSISKSGSHVEVYVEGEEDPWFPFWIEGWKSRVQ